ncbi:MAG: lysophospholipid acyltransferase family protein [Thermodesulfobacteriota bacterium]
MKDFPVYLVVMALVWFVNLLPEGAALTLGRAVGGLAFRLGGERRKMVIKNIKTAFKGEKTEEEMEAIARASYGNLGMSVVEFARLKKLDMRRVEESITFEGLENLKEAVGKGKGVVFLTAHLGSWEMLGPALTTKGYRGSSLVRPLDNGYLDVFVEGQRTMFGNSVIPRKNALRKMLEILRGGGNLGILLDQRSSRRDGVEVEFFGRPAPTSKGLAAVVMKTGSPVVPVFILRENGRKQRVIADMPVEAVLTGDREADIKENTRRFTSAIEKFVRLYPDQWLWLHSRWERRPSKRREKANADASA